MNKKSWFTKNDKWFLHKNLLSKFNKPIVCAEVGNLTGNSTRFFSKAIPDNSKFFSVDIINHDIDVPRSVIRVHSNSLEWECPDKLDFIYLDGNHSNFHVEREINKFSRVTNIIAGHDAQYVGYALFRQYQNKERHCELLFDNHCSSWIMTYM